MSNKVDELFKDKLGEHSLPPSAQAWAKVEANLTKKNKGIIWFRVAAVVALAGLLTFVLMKNGKEQPSQMAIKHPVKTEAEKTTATNKETVTPEQDTRDTKKEDNTVSTKRKQLIDTPEQKQRQRQEQKQEQTLTKTSVAQNIAVPDKKQMEPTVTDTHEAVIVATTQALSQKSIKLTFSLPALKTTADESKEAMVAATQEEKKTTLQKAVEKANEIRTGDVLGNLRDAKNDLFAWEFKKDKTKSNN